MPRFQLFDHLPITKKIAVGFGLTTLLFAAVVWIYHGTLFRALDDYDRLFTGVEARKTHLNAIYRDMLEASRAEKNFLARKRRKERFISPDSYPSLQFIQDNTGCTVFITEQLIKLFPVPFFPV